MKFETLNDCRKKKIIGGLVTFIILAVVIVVPGSRAKYQTTQSIDIVNGNITYTFADLDVIAMYVDDVAVSSLDDSKYYTLDTSSSYCTVNGEVDSSITLSWNMLTSELSVKPMETKNTKCYLYFETVSGFSSSDIVASKTIATRDDFSTVLTTDTTGTIYAYVDGMYGGLSYYYAGAVTDNYVYFANYWWRIIRINGDGSIRLIYDGTSAHENGKSNTDRYIGTTVYNSSNDASEYVGFTYTVGYQRGATTDSTIKDYLEDWYSSSGLSDYSNYLDASGKFCNDREMGSEYTWVSTGNVIRYAGYERNTGTPSLECSNSDDIYELTVGLITLDEVRLAGAYGTTSNKSYYLYMGDYYWTMTPSSFNSTYAGVFSVYDIGYCINNVVHIASGVRPVINLSPSVTLIGEGTSTNPYQVVTS